MFRRTLRVLAKSARSLAVLAAGASAVAGGFWLTDHLERRAVAPDAEARWSAVRTQVVSRLNGEFPLEFGAVWMTHEGRVCGLVNGGSSFGGLTGMTPFVADGGRILFVYDR